MKVLVAQSCLILRDPTDCSSPGSSVHGDSPSKKTEVGCHSLLQGIFPAQGWNPGLLHCRYILYQLREPACNAGDPGSIPWLGRSTGEGIGYTLQYAWASLVAQLVKNLPAMQETWVPSLGWEDPLEKGKATHSRILTWRTPWTVQSTGLQRVGHDWAAFTSLHFICMYMCVHTRVY